MADLENESFPNCKGGKLMTNNICYKHNYFAYSVIFSYVYARLDKYPCFPFGSGYLRWRGPPIESVDAHCYCGCKSDKKYSVNPKRPHKGRIMGYQLFFLQSCPGSMALHRAEVTSWTAAADKKITQRDAARQTGAADGTLDVLFDQCERDFDRKFDNANTEPILLP